MWSKLILTASILTLLVGFESASGQKSINARVSSSSVVKLEAAKLWELALAAKGGRARLLAIENLSYSSVGRLKQGGKTIDVRQEDLFVMPFMSWHYDDQRPSVFGLTMSMQNYEAGLKYNVRFGDDAKSAPEQLAKETQGGVPGLLYLLLTTKWDEVEPVSLKSGKYRKKRVDMVTVAITSGSMEFYLDKESHLPVRAVAFDKTGANSYSLRLDNYLAVDGVMMPHRITYEGFGADMTYDRTYLINTDYDESIFRKPPSFDFGPDAWRKRNGDGLVKP